MGFAVAIVTQSHPIPASVSQIVHLDITTVSLKCVFFDIFADKVPKAVEYFLCSEHWREDSGQCVLTFTKFRIYVPEW
jgi:hypothetical protein